MEHLINQETIFDRVKTLNSSVCCPIKYYVCAHTHTHTHTHTFLSGGGDIHSEEKLPAHVVRRETSTQAVADRLITGRYIIREYTDTPDVNKHIIQIHTHTHTHTHTPTMFPNEGVEYIKRFTIHMLSTCEKHCAHTLYITVNLST